LKLLLDAGADPNAATNGKLNAEIDGTSAAMWCASRGYVNCLELLIARGCAVDASDAKGRTAAMMAASCGSARCLAMLASAGCDLAAKDALGRSALDMAVEGSKAECRRLLEASLERAVLDGVVVGGSEAARAGRPRV
jgi:ankyrin repeat protein